MGALAAWCVRHRWVVLVGWLAVLVAITGVSQLAGDRYSNGSFALPNTDSQAAVDLIHQASPQLSGDVEQVVVQTGGGVQVTDPAVRQRFADTMDKIAKLPHVSAVTSPYSTEGAAQVSKDGTIAYATVTFDQATAEVPNTVAAQLVATAKAGTGDGATFAVAGQVAEAADPQDFGVVGVGIGVAGVVLLFVFGSVFGAVLPLVSALVSLGSASGVIVLLSHVLPITPNAPQFVLLVGLGVGVDYALFILTRHRQGLLAGKDVADSIATAVNTAGRAVFFAGTTVCIAVLGMFAIGLDFLDGIAVATALGVVFTMFSALTLTPAMLGFLGKRVLSGRQRRALAAGTVETNTVKGFWAWWPQVLARRPLIPAVAALAVVVLLALPIFSLRLAFSDQGNHPPNTTTRQAYDMITAGFGPGYNGPLRLATVVDGDAQRSALDRLDQAIAGVPGVAKVGTPRLLPSPGLDHGQVATVNVYPTTSPQDAATADLVRHLRDTTIPQAGSGLPVHVYGDTATFVDFSQVFGGRLPLFVVVIVGLSFLLLAMVFRSLLIPLTSAVMNLLTIGAAFGVLVAVFQWGWLADLVGVTRPGPTEAWLPASVFAVLFGLSMDYQVFLLSRMHEEWRRSGDNRRAITVGLANTGRTITAAALIMIVVFAAFVLGDQRVIKEIGLGLSVGVLVDAVFVRSALVPTLMAMFGRANWWLPRGLNRVLPRLAPEHTEVEAERAADEDVREPV